MTKGLSEASLQFTVQCGVQDKEIAFLNSPLCSWGASSPNSFYVPSPNSFYVPGPVLSTLHLMST